MLRSQSQQVNAFPQPKTLHSQKPAQEMHVGPRPGADESGETTPGVLVVTPLRLEAACFLGFPVCGCEVVC